MVIIVMGLPGSRKSYFAQRLSAALHAEYINSDGVRKTMMAKSNYTEKEKLSVYDEMLSQSLHILKPKKDLVIDATFYTNAIRKKFIDALEPKTFLQFIEIKASARLTKKRLQYPRTDSEADISIYYIIKANWEPFTGDHLILHSTNDNVGDMLHKTFVYLQLGNDQCAN